MQLSEFRDLLANDGFAATFQTMGQYRTELLRALDGLRAKADARPVAWTNAKELEGVKTVSEGYARAIWGAENESFATIPLFTHPEASAPGLSERERYLIDKAAERLREADFIDEASAVRAILTRASAATACALPEEPTIPMLEAISDRPWGMMGNGLRDGARSKYQALREAVMGANAATQPNEADK